MTAGSSKPGDTAQALARASASAVASGAGKAASEVRKHPFSTGALALGLVAGGALLLNPGLRRLAVASAPGIWRALRKR